MATTMTLISSYTVTGSSTSIIDFTTIPNTYTDLCIKLSSRHATSGGEDTPYIRFNNDSGSNYSNVFGSASASGAPPQSGSSSTTSFWVGTVPGSTDTSGAHSKIEIYVPNYAGTTFKKTLQGESTTGLAQVATSSAYRRIHGGYWNSTSAINRVTLGIVSAGYNYAVGTTAYIYGIKNS